MTKLAIRQSVAPWSQRRTALSLTGAILLTMLTGIGATVWVAHVRVAGMRAELLTNARMLTPVFENHRLAALSGTLDDLNRPQYHTLKRLLMSMQVARPQNRFLYLMGRHPNGDVFFYVDSEPEESANYSPPGQVYTEISAADLRVFETGKAAVTGPAADRWGTWVSALVPLQDPKSAKMVAVFGMDVDARDWARSIILHAAAPCLITVLAMCLIVAAFVYQTNQGRKDAALRMHAERMRMVSNCLLGLGLDFQDNVKQITTLAGSLFHGQAALYARLRGDAMQPVADWNLPQFLRDGGALNPEFCKEILEVPAGRLFVTETVPGSTQGGTAAVLRGGGWSTVWGCAVRSGNRPLGALCIFFTGGTIPSEREEILLIDLAAVLGAEESRHAAQQAEARFRGLLETIPEGLLVHDPLGRILFANEVTAARLAHTREELIGMNVRDLVTPEHAIQVAGRVAEAEQQGVSVFETTYVSRTGRRIEAEVIESRTVYEGQDAFISLARDATERKRAERNRMEMERRLLHSQKLESLGVLAGGVAHDFNNLLMAVLGNLELALQDLAPHSIARACVESANQAALRAAAVTRQILAYSGKGRVVVAEVNVNELLRANVLLLRSAISKTIAVNLVLAPELPTIPADASQVEQIFMNLLTNAAESTSGRDGVITVATGIQDFDGAYLAQSRMDSKPAAGRYVWIDVRDNGCGMDGETQHRLFEPFFTTKSTGRGLGMAAVMGIMRGHRGAIMVDSQLGQGTCVRVLFPMAAVS